MRALVTGADGFVGRYLVKFLIKRGYTICAADCYFRSDNLYPDSVVKKKVDITDKGILYQVVDEFKPDEIYHLAGIAATTRQDRERYYLVNFNGTLNLFESLLEKAPEARILYVSSANVYGSVPPEDQPITEERFFAPINHYAASKASGDAAACAYAAEGLHIVRARPFNHTGPGQTTDFVCSRLAKIIAEISAGLRAPVLNAGNLDVARDFTDVRDIVHAYWLLLNKGCPGEAYNLCSEKAYSVREVASLLADLGEVQIELLSQPDLQRKVDIPLLLGSAEKIRDHAGWSAEIPLRQTLADLLAWWKEVSKG